MGLYMIDYPRISQAIPAHLFAVFALHAVVHPSAWTARKGGGVQLRIRISARIAKHLTSIIKIPGQIHQSMHKNRGPLPQMHNIPLSSSPPPPQTSPSPSVFLPQNFRPLRSLSVPIGVLLRPQNFCAQIVQNRGKLSPHKTQQKSNRILLGAAAILIGGSEDNCAFHN